MVFGNTVFNGMCFVQLSKLKIWCGGHTSSLCSSVEKDHTAQNGAPLENAPRRPRLRTRPRRGRAGRGELVDAVRVALRARALLAYKTHALGRPTRLPTPRLPCKRIKSNTRARTWLIKKTMLLSETPRTLNLSLVPWTGRHPSLQAMRHCARFHRPSP